MTLADRLRAAAAVAATTMLPFERPDRIARALMSAAPWGVGLAGCSRPPPAGTPGTGDHRRRRRDHLPRAVAAQRPRGRGLRCSAWRPGNTVGVMCRNHRTFVEAAVGVARTGADLVLLNTGFPGPQLADVVASERPPRGPRRRVRRLRRALRGCRRDRRSDPRRVRRLGLQVPGCRSGPIPSREGRIYHPHLRYDRPAEGRGPRSSGPSAGTGAVGPVGAHPVQGPRTCRSCPRRSSTHGASPTSCSASPALRPR